MGKQHKQAKAAKKGGAAAAAAAAAAPEHQERHKGGKAKARRSKKDVHHYGGDDLERELAAVGLRIKQIEVRQGGQATRVITPAAGRGAVNVALTLYPRRASLLPGRWQLLLPVSGRPDRGEGNLRGAGSC